MSNKLAVMYKQIAYLCVVLEQENTKPLPNLHTTLIGGCKEFVLNISKVPYLNVK